MHQKSSRELLCRSGPISYDVKASPMILEALKKAQQGRKNATAGEATVPRKKARETIVGRETEQKKIPNVRADANEQGGPSLLRPRRIVAATFALLLFAGAIPSSSPLSIPCMPRSPLCTEWTFSQMMEGSNQKGNRCYSSRYPTRKVNTVKLATLAFAQTSGPSLGISSIFRFFISETHARPSVAIIYLLFLFAYLMLWSAAKSIGAITCHNARTIRLSISFVDPSHNDAERDYEHYDDHCYWHPFLSHAISPPCREEGWPLYYRIHIALRIPVALETESPFLTKD